MKRIDFENGTVTENILSSLNETTLSFLVAIKQQKHLRFVGTFVC